MTRLFRFQIAKILRMKSFWLMILAYITMHYAPFVIILTVVKGSVGEMGAFSLDMIMNRSDLWPYLTYGSSWLTSLLSFFVVLSLCRDLNSRWWRQQIMMGCGKLDEWLLLVIQSLSLALFALVTVTTLFVISNSSAATLTSLGDAFIVLARFYLQTFGYLGFAYLAAFYFRKPLTAFGILVLWSFALEPVLGWFINFYSDSTWGGFLPFAVLASMSPFPNLGLESVAMVPKTEPQVFLASLYTVVAYLGMGLMIKTEEF